MTDPIRGADVRPSQKWYGPKEGKPVRRRRKKLTVTCKCVACGQKTERTRYELRTLATGVRCESCGGNVVEARFVT